MFDVARDSRAAKRERIVALLAEQTGASDRAIARLAGVSPTTVGRLRGQSGQEAAQSGQSTKLDTGPDETGHLKLGRLRTGQPMVCLSAEVDSGETGHPELDGSDDGHQPDRQQPNLGSPGLANQTADDLGDTGPVLEVLGVDVCECGAEWISDGEGGRYCEDCGASHPKTPSLPFVLSPADERRAAVLAREIAEALGNARQLANMLPVARDDHHHTFLRHLDEAEAVAQRWEGRG